MLGLLKRTKTKIVTVDDVSELNDDFFGKIAQVAENGAAHHGYEQRGESDLQTAVKMEAQL